MTLCRNAAGERLYHALGGRPSEPISVNGEVVETDVVSGAFLFVRKAALDIVSGFDPCLLMYATEDDLCGSIKRAGYRVYYFGAASLVHAVRASVRRSNPFLIRWLFAVDLMRYHRKHGTTAARWLAVPVLFAAYLVDVAVILSRGGRWK
jgi:GT2 family glycosyltransferase